MKIQGPIEVELKVHITDGEMNGVVTIGFGNGRFPTETNLREAVVKFERDSMPDGFRLMTKSEWWDTVCPPTYDEADEHGQRYQTRFAVPGGNDYDV